MAPYTHTLTAFDCAAYLRGYIEARSRVTALHRLPDKEELLALHPELWAKRDLKAALKRLVDDKQVHTDGHYYATKLLETYPQ